MIFSRQFFRAVGICSVVSAATTLLLIFLPRAYAAPQGFEEQVALHANPLYMARLWIYFAHPFFVLVAAWGVAAKKLSTATGSVTTGFIFFVLWGFTEAAQQALSIVANNQTWRAGYAAATDDATRTLLRTHITGFEAVWDALFLLLLVGFLIANVLYGLATWPGRGLEKIISGFYFLAAGLTVLNLVGGYGGPAWLSDFMGFLYPFTQPIARALIGVWLWRGDETRPLTPA